MDALRVWAAVIRRLGAGIGVERFVGSICTIAFVNAFVAPAPQAVLELLRPRRAAVDARRRLAQWQQRRMQIAQCLQQADRKSTRLNSSHYCAPRMPSSACKQTILT